MKDILIGAGGGVRLPGRKVRPSAANGSSHAATFFRSCVALALSRGDGPRFSLHASAKYREYHRDLITSVIFRKRKLDFADSYHRDSVRAGAWLAWKNYVAKSRLKNSKHDRADSHNHKQLLLKAFKSWQTYWQKVSCTVDTSSHSESSFR